VIWLEQVKARREKFSPLRQDAAINILWTIEEFTTTFIDTSPVAR
jgi:hypothetical protein